jgi:hypothetical protein
MDNIHQCDSYGCVHLQYATESTQQALRTVMYHQNKNMHHIIR